MTREETKLIERLRSPTAATRKSALREIAALRHGGSISGDFAQQAKVELTRLVSSGAWHDAALAQAIGTRPCEALTEPFVQLMETKPEEALYYARLWVNIDRVRQAAIAAAEKLMSSTHSMTAYHGALAALRLEAHEERAYSTIAGVVRHGGLGWMWSEIEEELTTPQLMELRRRMNSDDQ